MAELEDVVELTEEVAQLADDAAYSIGRMKIALVVGCGVSIVGGVALGIFIAKRKYSKKYDEMLNEEIAKTKAFYQGQQKPPLSELVAESEAPNITPHPGIELVNMTAPYRSVDSPLPSDDPEAPVWDYKAEEAQREPGKPYIISAMEFMENAPDHTQDTLTYYEIDEVLADSRDDVIREEVPVIGEDNLRFGHGSESPNTVYIRNEEMQADFEVVRSNGSFTHEVLGLEHSDDRRRRTQRHHLSDD